MELKVEYKSVSELIPYANNAKVHGDTDTDAIMASIREFGFNNPILIWKGIIVAGHGRLIAAKRLGMETVPTISLDHLTDEQRRAYILADNKTAELSGWDFDVLDAELKDISEIDMSAFGFDMSEIEDHPDVADDEYDFDAAPDDGRVQSGQIWLLGNHRLMCGDSSSAEDVKNLMGGGASQHGFHRSAIWSCDR